MSAKVSTQCVGLIVVPTEITVGDGIKNGDEVREDCSGSCPVCKVNSSLMLAPTLSDACDIWSLSSRFNAVNAVCDISNLNSTQAPAAASIHPDWGTCDVPCATEYVPFYDECEPVLDLVFDRFVDDHWQSNATAPASSNTPSTLVSLQRFQDTCLSLSPAILLAKMDDLDDRCEVNVSGTVAYGASSTTTHCQDDDISMVAVTGYSCKQLLSRDRDMCRCSPPCRLPPHGRRFTYSLFCRFFSWFQTMNHINSVVE